MTLDAHFTVDSGIADYFCDPHSPWQRPTNENTSGLLRQLLLEAHPPQQITKEHLDFVAAELNRIGDPASSFHGETTAEAYAALVATAA